MDNREWLDRMEEWQRQRQRTGLDSYDWGAFRTYATRSYGHDPGIVPLPTFIAFAPDDSDRPQRLTNHNEEEIDTLAAGLEKAGSE